LRIAHFDPVTGAAGDMILAALLDAGAPLDEIRRGLASLPLPDFRLDSEEVRVRGFRACRLVLEIPDERTHRHLPEIREILAAGTLPAAAVEHALAVFDRLADAEARSHGIDRGKVHFHEVGALDAILDIAGSCLALHLLGVERVTFSALRLGTGEVNSAHGRIPVPVPAVLELTRGSRSCARRSRRSCSRRRAPRSSRRGDARRKKAKSPWPSRWEWAPVGGSSRTGRTCCG